MSLRAALVSIAMLGAGCSSGCRGDGSPPARTTPPAAEAPASESLSGSAKKVSTATAAVIKDPIKAERLPSNERSPIGTNLAAMRDYTGEWPFVDAFKQSRTWISGTASAWQDNRPIDRDADGWVKSLQDGQLVRTLFFWREDGLVYPTGSYVVLYDGEGTMEWTNARVSDQRPGRMVVEVTNQQGFALLITATHPKNYLRNIRVLMPGGVCEKDQLTACLIDRECGEAGGKCLPFERSYEKQVFHPTFLRRIRSYSVLRFMEWMDTSHGGPAPIPQKTWADRPKPSHARYTERGVPVEVMVDLANRLDVDPWFTMNHMSDDDYVRQFATYVRDHLKPGKKAWIEHSNEVWNSMFEQSKHARLRGLEQKLSTNEGEAQLRYHSQRSVEIFKIWEKVFGGKDRLMRVMGSAAVNPWISKNLLAYKNASEHTDALAIAPYFGGYMGNIEAVGRVNSATLDQLIADLEQRALPEAAKMIREAAEVTKAAKVKLVAYEGGQHLAAYGPAIDDRQLVEKLIDVNRHPKMKQLYLEYLRLWREAGGELFVHYNSCLKPSRHGSWGALESMTQPREAAPKFDALMDFIEKNPRWW